MIRNGGTFNALNCLNGVKQTFLNGFLVLSTWLIALHGPSPVTAQEFLYYFSGSVTQIDHDNAGLVAGSGLVLGSPVEYVFLVDFQRPGTVTRYDGSTEVLEDLPGPDQVGNWIARYFFADLQSGNVLQDPAAEALRPDNHFLDHNYGVTQSITASFVKGMLVGGGVYSYVGVSQEYITFASGIDHDAPPWGYSFGDVAVQSWEIGERVIASVSASDADLRYSGFVAQVTLDKITVIPEPTTGILLLAWALICGARCWMRPRPRKCA